MSDAPARKPRRRRGAQESLLSIVLLLEAIVMFFVILVAYGLRVLPLGVILGGGAVLIALMLVVGRYLRHPAAVWTGWALQAVLILLGLLINVMYVIGVLFLALWIYCFIVGRRLDRRNSQFAPQP
jgi:Flp pilus assembly protein TadB